MSQASAGERPRSRVLAANIAANLARGLAASGLNILLPLVLLVLLEPHAYAAWALVFALGAMVGYLDLGIPVSIQAFAGRSAGGQQSLRSIFVSGAMITAGLGLVALAGSVGLSFGLPTLFPDLPVDQVVTAQVALPVIAMGQIANLLMNTGAALFTGLQESHVPALVTVPARVASLGLSVAAALATENIAFVALGYAVPLSVAVAVLFGLAMRRTRRSEGSVVSSLALLRSSASLAVWGVAMMIVSSAGTIIVARVDFGAVPLYSFALVFVAGLTGLEAAVSSPMLSELGDAWARKDVSRFRSFLRAGARANSLMLFLTAAVAFTVGPLLSPLFVDSAAVSDTAAPWVFALLLGGSALRQSFTPYSFALIASGRHRRIVFPPLIEASVNVVASVLLGQVWGAAGVAAGFAIGSLVGVLMFVCWSLRRSGLDVDPTSVVLMQAVAKPVVVLVPAVIALVASASIQTSTATSYVLAATGCVAAAILAWCMGIRRLVAARSPR